VALSGGLDSVVLLHLLVLLREHLAPDLGLEAVHVHHGLLPEADAWADFCARRCAAWNVPCRIARVQVNRAHPGGLEAAAREARHAVLDGPGADLLALAHHQDDQAETVLFRILRGAGVRGAAGMAPWVPARKGRLARWRPLLDQPKAALHQHALAAGLAWVEDPSNQDIHYSRNFLRQQALPLLAQRFPGAAGGFARLGRLAGEADQMLADLARLDEAALGVAPWGRAEALALSSARLRNLWRHQLTHHPTHPWVCLPEEDLLLEVERQFRGDAAPAGLQLPVGDALLCCYRDAWWWEMPGLLAPTRPRVWRGEGEVPWGRGVLRFIPDQAGLALPADGRVEIRLRAGGERLRLHPARPARSLKNLYQEAGIPPWARPGLPLVWLDGALVWVGGIGAGWPPPARAEGPRWRLAWDAADVPGREVP
jgi:tRNA(Ile)-lysidine synthase